MDSSLWRTTHARSTLSPLAALATARLELITSRRAAAISASSSAALSTARSELAMPVALGVVEGLSSSARSSVTREERADAPGMIRARAWSRRTADSSTEVSIAAASASVKLDVLRTFPSIGEASEGTASVGRLFGRK